ncbi:hypothetical protein G7046_g5131 [Stylonectria norvegica]|nr:hypothetical protein G7046_g5131 [Stylonectria norvegica]
MDLSALQSADTAQDLLHTVHSRPILRDARGTTVHLPLISESDLSPMMTGSRSEQRQNACKGCTKAKRACDRQLPMCGRCVHKEIECQYFSRLRRNETMTLAPRLSVSGREARQSSITGLSQSPVKPSRIQSTAVARFPEAWDVLNGEPFESSIVTPVSSPPSIVHYIEPKLSWFLEQGSWDIKPIMVSTPATPSSQFKNFARSIRGWLQDWATSGNSLFIHKQLYHPGLPCSLQDAYTTLVAYLAKNEENEDIVMQILENRAAALSQQALLLEGVETLDTKAHLARTQALLVYTLVRLFDGCPRQRSIAEGMLYTLCEWCHQMRDSAIAEAPRLYGEFGTAQLSGDGADVAIWRAWLVSESVRRTWMVVSCTTHIYQTKRDGFADCSGILRFTTRQGLWHAPNAWRWLQLLRKQSPLFAESLNLTELMEETPSSEMDAFANQVLRIALPPEKIDRWIEKAID